MDAKESELSEGRITYGTYTKYKRCLRRWLLTTDPEANLANYTPFDFKETLDAWRRAGRTRSALNDQITVVKSVCHWAEDYELVAHCHRFGRDFATDMRITAEQRIKREGKYLKPDGVTDIISLKCKTPLEWKAICLLGINLALEQSTISRLTPADWYAPQSSSVKRGIRRESIDAGINSGVS